MNALTPDQEGRILALLREGKSLRRIEFETGHRRETIAAYGRRAGLCGDRVATFAPRPDVASVCDPFRERIERGLAAGRSLRSIHAELVEAEGLAASYSALKRYVRVSTLRSRTSTTVLLAA